MVLPTIRVYLLTTTELIKTARDIIADGDAHGEAAEFPTSVVVRQIMERLCNDLEAHRQ